MEALQDKKLNKKLERHLKNYLIIRTVTLAENFFQNKAKEIIDKHDLDVSGLIETTAITDLESTLKNTNRTKGELIATNFSFQNELHIDFVFSQLLGIKFFHWATFFKGLFVFSTQIYDRLLINPDFLFDIFELRHKIVHNIWTIVDYDSERVIKLSFTMIAFLASCEAIIDYQLTAPKNKKLPKTILNFEKP